MREKRDISIFAFGFATALVVAALTGCHSDDGSGPAPTPTPSASPTPIPTPTPDLTSCTSSLVDAGQKGNVAAVARGVYSDTKMIPGTSNPSTAFVDPSAVVMKIAYWNGSQFNTEVISGDGTGAFVRLAFTSEAIPLVFWTLGANLKVAIRSAPLGTPGTWSAGIIDTGVAPRAVEVSVNPLNAVMVSFLTDTATTGRPKFLFCNAPCTSASGFQTMTPNAYIENTAIVAAQVATGAGWCQASASTFYPAVAYAVTGAVHYAVCQNTLSNCLSSANWVTQSIVATGNVSTKLYLDPTITGDVPKAVSLGAGGVVPYVMGSTACTATPAAFSAGSAIGDATTGNLWMTLMKDPTGIFHLVANESTTAAKYFNSTSTTLTSAWNTAGVVETNTLAAANAGGAALDSSTNGVYASYGINAVPFDLHMGRVENYTQASSSATFSLVEPDLTGDLQLSAANSQLRNTSMASTSTGDPAVAYTDYSIGAAANAKLKFALRTEGGSQGTFEPELVPDTINPEFPSLAFDRENRPWIGYFDAGVNRFYLATNSHSDGTGSWSTYLFPAIPAGAPIALPAANHTAIAMMNVGGTISPVMIVIDTNAGSKGVKASVFNPSTRNWSTVTSVDALTTGALGAAFLTADADASGDVVIAYQDLSLTRVKYASTNGGATWTTPITISQLNQGPGISISLNPTSGSPGVTYFDQTNNLVVYNACSGSVSGCASGGWTPTTIEGAAGVSGIAAASAQLLQTSLGYTPQGAAYVLYPRGLGNDGNLVLSTNQTGSFVSTVIGHGVNGSLTGAPALNFGVAGWSLSAAKNEAGSVTAAYVGPGDWLYSVSCGD